MNYVKSFDLFGVPAKQIPATPGSGAPTTATEGAVGCLYMDTDTGNLYKCTGVADGVYTWKTVDESANLTGYVQTVNGVAPDVNGNVEITIPGGSGGEPAEDDIPKVFITGVKPTTKNDVLAEMRYISKTDKFHAYLEIKCQGTSSMSYAKKNFTVKLYSDEARETKLKKDFKDWNHPSNKFVLKANWIDHSHARNIVSARLWGEVVASRSDYASLPVEMRNAPNNGAVDGFPVKVYYNGNYEGIYTWNVGKDDWQWGMDKDNANHVLLCAETNNNGSQTATPCNFRALWSGVNEQHWSVEVGTNSTALKNSLNNLIQFVMDNDGTAFRNGIGKYLDIRSAIDYYIFQYEICGLDGLAKNMLLATYDGTKWICGAYDLDATFGLWWNGSSFVAATFACPEDYQEDYSLLWERIEANFQNELKSRQAELRKTVLSYSNMVTHFERFMDVIGLDLYAEDLTIYTAIPSAADNNIQQIRNYIRDRQAYVDAEFAAMEGSGETEKLLTSISTTYSGGDVVAGTAVTALNGIVVTAHYFDGSTATVTGYTLSGTIAEGSNTITVSYGGMTTTFTVTGVSAEATSITLDKTEVDVTDEYFVVLTATTVPANAASAVVWTSDNEEVATVDGGIVRILANGTAKITASTGEISASCNVTVTEPKINYTWSDTNEYGQTNGVVGTSDKYLTDMFVVPAGNYRVVNNHTSKVWGSIATFKNDETFVVGVASTTGLDSGNILGAVSIVDGFSNKIRMDWTNTNITLERNRGLWTEYYNTNAKKCGFAIDSTTGDIKSGGDCVTAVKIPVLAGKMYSLANKAGGAFQWKGVAEYKADGTFVKFTQQQGTTDAHVVTLTTETALVRLIAAKGTDPNTYLEFTRIG